MIIEFIGMPGSGKTTIAVGLASLLEEDGVDVLHNADGSAQPEDLIALPRYRRNIQRVLTIASLPALALSVAVRSTSRARAAEMWRLVTRELRHRSLRDVSHELVILDEGSLHKLCTMYAEGDLPRPLDLLSRLTAPSLCIVLRLDVNVAVERIHARTSHSPVDAKPNDELMVYLRRYRDCEDALIDRLSCPVVSVDSSREDATRNSAVAVREYLNSGERNPFGRLG